MPPDPHAVFPDCPDDLAELLTAELRARVPELRVHIGIPTTPEAAILRMQGAPALLLFDVYMSEAVMAACPALRSITYLSTGIASHVDLAAAARRGIRCRNIHGYGDRAIAEHAFALALAAARHVPAMDRDLRAGRWEPRRGMELGGKVLGIIGLGGNGREVARIGHGFGMEVIAWNRSGVPEGLPCRAAELEELLARADVVSLHLALNDETRGFLSGARIARMKPGAILVNTARAALVDEAALIAALRDGRLGHAAFDVFWQEPLASDHPFTHLPNVTMSAHAAWYSVESMRRLLEKGLATLREELDRLQ
ncbi:MAG: 3-phosphoglycerate dehydrogenase [Alphaproteobacteria bacterium]|nr:3-phosphoglycerate dehydrogenase [Alphaproteobacteria bacterium]